MSQTDPLEARAAKIAEWWNGALGTAAQFLETQILAALRETAAEALEWAAQTAALDRQTIATLRARCERLGRRNLELQQALAEARKAITFAYGELCASGVGDQHTRIAADTLRDAARREAK